MAITSTEPSLSSSLPSSFDGEAVGHALALRTTACDGDWVAIGFAMALGTTACSGDGAISVAAALKTIALNGNKGNNEDDGDDGEGVAVSIAAALSCATLGSMGSLPSNGTN
jgi:hypothetical protein